MNAMQLFDTTTMAPNADWKTYELEIHSELESKFSDAVVQYNVQLQGQLSGRERQIDVLIEENLPNGIVRTIVDAKHHSRKIDVKEIESFIGLLHDTNASRGILVSSSGYTKAAFTRAFRDDVDLDLDVLTLDEFKMWQAAGAMAYSDPYGVLVPAPFGWVIDGQRIEGILARLYRRGLTFEEAAIQMEFMYINIWSRTSTVKSLEDLLAKQEADIRNRSPEASIDVRYTTGSLGYRAAVRRADIPGYPTAEITGFIEFPESIFFAVLFTPLTVERRNVRKLEYLLQKALPISVIHNDA